MPALRKNSPRPTLIVDPHSHSVGTPAPTQLGLPGPLGRERVLFALPLSETPAQFLNAPTVLLSPRWAMLEDPTATPPPVLGAGPDPDRVWVPRMMVGRKVEDTRRQ